MAERKEPVHGSVCLSNQCGQVGGGLENKSFVKDPTAMSGTFQGWLIWTRSCSVGECSFVPSKTALQWEQLRGLP